MTDLIPGYNAELPANWKMKTIDQLSTRVGSGVTPRGGSEVYKNDGIIFIRSQNVTFGGLDLSDVAFIDNQTHRLMQASDVFPFDVLLNITGASIGRCCFVPSELGRVNQNQHVCTIRLPNPNWADAKFLSSVLSSPIGQSQIFRLNAGGNREGLNYQQLRSFDIVWPSPSERSKIAEILSTVDRAIEQTEALIAKQQRIKTGLMQDLLTRGIDEHGNLRSKETHEFKDSPLGRIPIEWEPAVFKERIDLVHGHQFRNYDFTEAGIPVVKIGQVTEDGLDLSDCSFVANHRKDEFQRYRIRAGDVLMALTGATLGKVCTVSERFKDQTLLQNYRVGRFEPLEKEDVDKTYLYFLLQTDRLLNQVFSRVNSGAQGNVGKTDFERALLVLPSFEEQVLVGKILSALDARANQLRNGNSKLQLIKTALMQDLLTGEKRVTPLLDVAGEAEA